jgi:hypothetical protein
MSISQRITVKRNLALSPSDKKPTERPFEVCDKTDGSNFSLLN